MKGLFGCVYAVVGLRTMLAWMIAEGLLNPAVLFFGFGPLATCKLVLPLILGEIMPSSGVAALLRDC